MRAGIEECRRLGHKAVVVLGHPDYYHRFGFISASAFGLKCEFDVPEGVFMALEFESGALAGKGGKVKYQPEFSEG